MGVTTTVAGDPVASLNVRQYFNLLTGVMTDQAITLRNILTVGGNQAVTDTNLTIIGVAAQTGVALRTLLLSGDSQPAFSVSLTGLMRWGPGGATVTDLQLYRRSDAHLYTRAGTGYENPITKTRWAPLFMIMGG